MTQAQAGVRQSTRLSLTLRHLQLADATGRHHRQTLCAVWQEERGCPLRGLWPPLQAPCSSSLHSGLCSVPGRGKTPGLPILSPDCPRASKDPSMPIALGFLVPTGPELWVVHGRPRAPVLVPNACRDGCRWVNPSLAWLSAAAQPYGSPQGSQAAGATPPAQLHLVSFTLCVAPCPICWVVAPGASSLDVLSWAARAS